MTIGFTKFNAGIMTALSFLSWSPQGNATPLTDIFPPDGVFSKARDLPMTFGYDDKGSRKWDDMTWKKAIEEALKEWDDIICNTQSFSISDKYQVSFQWQTAEYFKKTWGYTDALAVYVKSEDEIYFNSNIDWDFTLGEKVEDKKYGFRWVAKHEIGHALGIAGDWGQDEPFVDENNNGKYDDGEKFTDINGDEKWGKRNFSWNSPDEIMWGVFDSGTAYDGLKESDIRALRELGYHVPEPSILWLIGACVATMLPGNNRRPLNFSLSRQPQAERKKQCTQPRRFPGLNWIGLTQPICRNDQIAGSSS